MTNFQISGQVVTENQVLAHHEVVVDQGIIQSIDSMNSSCSHAGNQSQLYILPAFRDQHVHDWTGQHDAVFSREDEVTARIQSCMRTFARHGVSEVYLATVGDTLDHLLQYARAARTWMDNPENGRDGARLRGLFIEGTFINVLCRGAQPAECCLIPGQDDCIQAIDQLKSTGSVKLVNIVPDYGDPSLHLIRHAAQAGMLVGSGHTQCPAELLQRAYVDCDLRFMVHYTNGPTGQSFKPFGGGGAFEGGLNLPLVKELILDRNHVDDRYVLDIIHRQEERWGSDSIVGITDALFPDAADIPDGEFTIGSTTARPDRKKNVLFVSEYLQKDGSRISAPANTLCGSILTMDQAFGNLVDLFTSPIQGHWYDHPGIPLEDAVVKAARFCSTNQAKLDGSYAQTGSITVGKKADLVVGTLEKKEKRYTFHVQCLMIEGRIVYQNRSTCFL